MFDAELDELSAAGHGRSLPSNERRASIHAAIRARARTAPEQLAEWIRTVDPCDAQGSTQLADMYEALAPDAVALEGFFLDELDRVLSACEAHPESKEAFAALGALMFLESPAPTTMKAAIRSRLMAGLRSSSPSVRRACVDLIGGHDIGRDATARSAVVECLRDPDWKVRALAESSLSEDGLVPSDYHVSIVDRLRRKMSSWTDYV